MDAHASILTYIHNLLTTDSQLKTIMGGSVSLHPQWKPADTPKPYIVQMVDMRRTDEPFPLRNGSLTLHLWSDSENATEILNMRDRCVILLDERKFTTDDISGCRVWLGPDDFIPDEPGIWHYVIIFNLRLYKATEAEAILAREGM